MANSHREVIQRGYEMRAAYALYNEGLDWLAGRCSYADLGAAAGSASGGEDGLSHFKRGWATDTKPTHLCMRALNPAAYEKLARSVPARTDYFPAYRAGELV